MIFMKKNMHNLSKSNIVAEIPLACSDETAAVEFFEFQRWGDTPFLLFAVYVVALIIGIDDKRNLISFTELIVILTVAG